MKTVKKIFSGILSAGLAGAGLLGASFSIISLGSLSNDLTAIGGFFLGLGFTVGSWGAAAMLHLRGNAERIGAKLVGAMLLWGAGSIIFGLGGLAAFSVGERSILENLGFSIAICFVPGFFLALGSIVLFLKERKQNLLAVTKVIAQAQDERLIRAQAYVRQIFTLLRQKNVSSLLSDKIGLQTRLNDWQAYIETLVVRLENLQSNQLTRQDFQNVPQNIDTLTQALENENNPNVRRQLEETLESLEAQKKQLTKLESLMRRIDLEIDESLASIATIHSQLQLLGSTHSIDSARAARLSADVEEAAERLDDVLSAMDNAYQNISRG